MYRRIRILERKVVSSENQAGISIELERKVHGPDIVPRPSHAESTYMHASSAYGQLPGMHYFVSLYQFRAF